MPHALNVYEYPSHLLSRDDTITNNFVGGATLFFMIHISRFLPKIQFRTSQHETMHQMIPWIDYSRHLGANEYACVYP